VVLRDEKAVFSAGAYNARYGVALSLPGVVGSAGASEVLWLDMSEEEARALGLSAETLKGAVSKYVKAG
jgi:malate/lactate dehydrogenase